MNAVTSSAPPSKTKRSDRLEPAVGEPAEPLGLREHALDVMVVDDPDRHIALSQSDDVVDLVGRAGRIGVSHRNQPASSE